MLEKNELNNKKFKNDPINNYYIFPDYEEEQIKEAFDVFDFNGNNYISAIELKEIFNYINEEVTEDEIDEMINLVDKEGNGQVNWINFYEFVSGKIIKSEIKEMKKTPDLYPDDNFNKQQHLKKSKIKFINSNEINHKINGHKKKEDTIKTTNIRNEINNEKDKYKDSILRKKNYKNELSNENDNNEEDNHIDNYVREILKKRKERLENNYLLDKVKINNIEEKNRLKPKKLILKDDDNNKNKIITYDSFSESSIENEQIDYNKNIKNIDDEYLENNESLNTSKNLNEKDNKTKISNFLPLDRTNSMRKIKPIISENNNDENKFLKIKNNKIGYVNDLKDIQIKKSSKYLDYQINKKGNIKRKNFYVQKSEIEDEEYEKNISKE